MDAVLWDFVQHTGAFIGDRLEFDNSALVKERHPNTLALIENAGKLALLVPERDQLPPELVLIDVVNAGIGSCHRTVTAGPWPYSGTGSVPRSFSTPLEPRLHIVRWLGDDWIVGGIGNDSLFGDNTDEANEIAGQDMLSGGAGEDLIVAGGGNDSAYGDAGVYRIYGGFGDDDLHGGSEVDFIYGGSGGGVFGEIGGEIEQDGNDRIFGDSGGDVLDAGAGNNTIHGGEGTDEAVARSGDAHLPGGLRWCGTSQRRSSYLVCATALAPAILARDISKPPRHQLVEASLSLVVAARLRPHIGG